MARAHAAAAVPPTTGAVVGRQRASMGCDCDCAAEDYGFFAEEGCGFDASGCCDPGGHQLAASLVTTAALASQFSTMSSWTLDLEHSLRGCQRVVALRKGGVVAKVRVELRVVFPQFHSPRCKRREEKNSRSCISK